MRLGWILVALASLLMSPAALAKCELKLADLQVTMAGLQPLIPVKIDGNPVMFLVDSGAFYSTISSANAKRFGLHEAPLDLQLSGVGGETNAGVATVKTFTIADTPLKNRQFVIGGSEIGQEAAGIVGQDILQHFDVEYDLADGVIRLGIPHGCSGTMLAYWGKDAPISIMPIEIAEGLDAHIKGTVLVNGVKLHAMFDTGADTTVLSVAAAKRVGVRTDSPGVVVGEMNSGIGRRRVRSWIAPFDSVEIGGIKVLRTKLSIGDFDLGDADLLVGADFFLSTRVMVSNSQHKMYFTYNGGRMFNLAHVAKGAVAPTSAAASAVALAEPKDADGYARRGAALLARGEVERAIADLSRACDLSPNEPRYRYRRALARIDREEDKLAMEDLDTALKLKPGNTDVLVTRAELRLKGEDKAGAAADLDAAAAALPAQSTTRLRLAQSYEALDLFKPAVREYDLWITYHVVDSGYLSALNGRCWASALGNFDLDRGLADCDRAVARTSRGASELDSRGMAHLRRGEYARAIADYDAALAKTPGMGWSLYGRGVARLKAGDKAGGEADLAAAAKVAPKLAERAKGYGIVP